VGQFKEADFALFAGAGERSAFITEELGFEQVFREGGAVDLHEGLVLAPAVLVDELGQQALARSRFSQDQDVGRFEVGQLQGDAQNLPHRAAVGNDFLLLEFEQAQFYQFLLVFFGHQAGLLEFFPDGIELRHVAFVNHYHGNLAGFIKNRGAGDQKDLAGPLKVLDDADLTFGFQHLQGDGTVEPSFSKDLLHLPADDVVGLDAVEPFRGFVDIDDPCLPVADPDAVRRRLKNGVKLAVQVFVGFELAG